MKYQIITVYLVSLLCCGEAIFRETINPYLNGSLTKAIKEVYLESEKTDGLESDTLILYPDNDDVFGVFYFIGGWSGIVPGTVYSTYLNKVAAHGFIVVAPWPLSSAEPIDADVVYTALMWAKNNLQKFTGRAKPDFDHLGVGAHSAGANLLLQMLKENKTSAQAFIGMEPFSTDLESTVPFSIPGLFLGTELSENSCAIPGFGFANFYRHWKCPRAMVEAKAVGHCAILDDFAWNICDITQRCRTGDPALLPSFRQFVQGYTAAFLMVHLQGSPEYNKYITDTSLMPFALKQQRSNVNC